MLLKVHGAGRYRLENPAAKLKQESVASLCTDLTFVSGTYSTLLIHTVNKMFKILNDLHIQFAGPDCTLTTDDNVCVSPKYHTSFI